MVPCGDLSRIQRISPSDLVMTEMEAGAPLWPRLEKRENIFTINYLLINTCISSILTLHDLLPSSCDLILYDR